MIEIAHLNKIYKSKKRKKCHALKDINLTLPDNGLVFVLGKSGSGKSTLLNLIGGLDNITSGSITVDGNNLSKFREKAFCNYRNTHIGFIFQDYHLIDELTVYDNIALSLNLRRIKDKEAVSKALAKVDLAGYEDRYPTELSGGEQQRVAIARAIVKKPRIILADEPTGNLDTNTATAIVTLLKELSKECLILIVSHNINDANNYADRIIELRKGEIISDKSRNPEFLDEMSLADGKLVYPQGLALSDSDITFINQNLTNFVKRTDKFIPTSPLEKEARKVRIENKGLSLWKKLHLSGKFLKSKTFAISASAVMVSIIMVIMAMAQTIINFDAGRILQDEMNKANQNSLLLNKGVDGATQKLLDRTYSVPIGEGDIQAFYDAGYNGTIYPVISHCISMSGVGHWYGLGGPHFQNSIYMSSTFGTMIVDEAFLERKFDGLNYAARVNEFKPYGLLITDYVADAILSYPSKYNGGTYEDLLGGLRMSSYTYERMYINGIIDTGYKERYKELFDKIEADSSLELKDLYEDSIFQEFSIEIYDTLGYCYTTNSNFVNDLNQTILAAYPTHYKLNFNGIDYINTSEPYMVHESHQTVTITSNQLLARDWMYTTQCPEIPKGAKYIRVSFNDAVDSTLGSNHIVAKLPNAILQFSGRAPVSAEQMMAVSSNSKAFGVFLSSFDGTIFPDNRGNDCTYISDFIEIPAGASIEKFAAIAMADRPFCVFYDENKEFISAVNAESGTDLPDKTIVMNLQNYNEIFGTDYTAETAKDFKPHKVTLTHYSYHDAYNENPLFSVEVTIQGLLVGHGRTMDVSDDIHALFAKDAVRTYSLYFDGTDGIGSALQVAEDLHYQQQSIAIEGIHTMTKAVDVFVPIFELVAIFLCLGVVFILVNFASKMIRDKMHEIGILKALGTKNGAIIIVFGLQVFLVALLTAGLSTVGYYYFIDFANDVLFQSMQQLVPSQVVLDLDFFVFMPKVALTNCLLVFALSAISLITPMLKIKAIKPVKIIKAKE